MTAVVKHELSLFYHSLSAYVFGAFLLVFTGVGALIYNINASVANFEYVLHFISFVYIIIVPLLTMRIIAEEKRTRTDQLLYSLPIRSSEVVIGKFIALAVMLLIPVCIIGIYPLIFSRYGDVYLPASYGSLFAFYVMGLGLLSIGEFISSCTESQGMAAGITVMALLLNYLLPALTNYIPHADFLAELSLFQRFNSFVQGIFDMKAMVFFISVIIFFLFLSVQSLERRRYHG